MGQSQPKTPPIPTHSTTHPHTIITEHVKKLLGNHKMVRNEDFKAFIQSSDNSCNGNDKSTVYNERNCSIYERELPDELFIHILGYLSDREIIKSGRICKNFKYYWLENIGLWRGRSFEGEEPFMYFKPILETPSQTIAYYYNHFLPTIMNSFTKVPKELDEVFIVSKFVLMGSEKCGKSEFMKMLLNPDREFDPVYTKTIGADFGVLSFQFNNQFIKNQIWDCSGSPIFSSILRSYSRGTRVGIFCFNLNDEESFTNMKQSIQSFSQENLASAFKFNENLKYEKKSALIIGMKRDLERKVPLTKITEYLSDLVPESNSGIMMNDLKVQYFELSNKTDTKNILLLPLLYGSVLLEEEEERSVVSIPVCH